jgi:hypothetical protein
VDELADGVGSAGLRVVVGPVDADGPAGVAVNAGVDAVDAVDAVDGVDGVDESEPHPARTRTPAQITTVTERICHLRRLSTRHRGALTARLVTPRIESGCIVAISHGLLCCRLRTFGSTANR